MRTNYIEYHLRLQEERPKQGKLFSEEYPEPPPLSAPEPSEPIAEDSYSSFGSDLESAAASTSGLHATSIIQTIFNVVGMKLAPSVHTSCRRLVAQHAQSQFACCRQICLLVWVCCQLHMRSSWEVGRPCWALQPMQPSLQSLVSDALTALPQKIVTCSET